MMMLTKLTCDLLVQGEQECLTSLNFFFS